MKQSFLLVSGRLALVLLIQTSFRVQSLLGNTDRKRKWRHLMSDLRRSDAHEDGDGQDPPRFEPAQGGCGGVLGGCSLSDLRHSSDAGDVEWLHKVHLG